jgi:hypothetical protein
MIPDSAFQSSRIISGLVTMESTISKQNIDVEPFRRDDHWTAVLRSFGGKKARAEEKRSSSL